MKWHVLTHFLELNLVLQIFCQLEHNKLYYIGYFSAVFQNQISQNYLKCQYYIYPF